MTIDELCDRISFFLDFNHWTLYKLANEAGLPYSSLRNIFNRKTYPTIVTLEKICSGFNISMSEFFDDGKNPLRIETLSEDEQIIINRYRSLSKYNKDLVNAYMKGIAHE